jgi:NAD(P)-dependent dehydrogenase (short-subunit alcohol dehydrogenase family)
VLGASSGFGAATGAALARTGCHIVGVHLDRRTTKHRVAEASSSIEAQGRLAWFHNTNAADESKRDAVLDDVASRWAELDGRPSFCVLFHSLAFGSLLPFIGPDVDSRTSQGQLEMTSLVMAHSLVSWAQAIVGRGMMRAGGRIFAMTSTGASSVWKGYGAVSAAKAALEAHVRQLAVELAPLGITVNALCAGVTETPALRKIPDHEQMKAIALRKNPHGRLTQPDDVAAAVVALAQPQTHWITGNVIRVDGGESIVG